MGGKNEKTHQGQTPVGSSKSPNAVRYHENKGEVHFHDDQAALKVAIPVAEFRDAWEQHKPTLSERNRVLSFVDRKAGTMVKIKADVDINKHITTDITVSAVVVDSTFQDLDDFAKQLK